MNELLAEMQEMFNSFMIQVDNFIAERKEEIERKEALAKKGGVSDEVGNTERNG